MLTDIGRKDCGPPTPALLLALLGPQPDRTTPHRGPLAETNGFGERFHRTVDEVFFAVAFRKTTSESFDQPGDDPDRDLSFYQRKRVRQGYRTEKRAPWLPLRWPGFAASAGGCGMYE